MYYRFELSYENIPCLVRFFFNSSSNARCSTQCIDDSTQSSQVQYLSEKSNSKQGLVRARAPLKWGSSKSPTKMGALPKLAYKLVILQSPTKKGLS